MSERDIEREFEKTTRFGLVMVAILVASFLFVPRCQINIDARSAPKPEEESRVF